MQQSASLEQLPALAVQAKGQFRAMTAADVQSARGRLEQARAKLERFLGRGAAAKGWRRYLDLDSLDAQLKAGSEAAEAPLVATLRQFRTDQAGLERAEFTKVAAVLADYLATLGQARDPNAKASYDARLDQLSTSLAAYAKTPSSEELKKIGAELDWLDVRHQAQPLVESIKSQLSQPNLIVTARGDFLATGLNRHVDDSDPVRDTILGTSIRGTGRTQAKVSFRLIPNSERALLEATLSGVNRARTTGYNGPAIIHSVGTTRLTASQRLAIDDDGLHGLATTVDADTDSSITGIGSSKRGFVGCIVKKVASQRASQQQGQAESIASQHAEKRLRTQFEKQIGAELAKGNRQFQDRFRGPLVRRGQLPILKFSTTDQELRLVALQAKGAQLGAQGPAPQASGKSQILLRLHESMANNFAGGTLAGQTIGQKELEKFAMDFMGEVPERLKDDPDREPWSITFDDAEPVTFTVAEGGFALTGRGKKYTSGDRSYPAMNFTVRYKVEPLGKGVKGTRIGDIEIFPPGFVPGSGRSLSLRHTTLRRLMMRRLSKIFEPEIVKDEATELKGEWKTAGPLAVTEIAADRGWLTVGWSQDRSSSTLAKAPVQAPEAKAPR
ncbi:MAG: hypothetical protein HYX69_14515 [Planctomycetia bacterium]|nr:hypothetical protein [Planctomycetia bacterium]